MIRIEKLKKDFVLGEITVHALKGVSFEIQKGEFVGIMGQSGSGKSTLLRQMGLIDTPSSGEIFFDDVPTHQMSKKEQSRFRLETLGYIFQEYALVPELTAIENVMLPAMMRGLKKEDYENRATELLETVGLGDRLTHRPKELSGGQQQRVAIARSLINNPKVLFADEPTASLDSESSKSVMDTFKKLNTEFTQTIVLVTHEPENKKYLDHVIMMKDGLIQNPRKK